MTDRGILYQGDLVRAILRGDKTETRRIMTTQPEAGSIKPVPWGKPCQWLWHLSNGGGECFSHRFGVPGDVLWVRETWAMIDGVVQFRADFADDYFPPGGWKVAIHLRRADSRADTTVLSVHPERVQKIDEGGARREGFRSRDEFCVRWNQINPGNPVHLNPWVWVIKFSLR